MKLVSLIKICRPQQWYKNLIIFIPIIFAQQFFNTTLLQRTILGFLSLILMSSVNYIINDVIDIKKDKLHPEKKDRPLASGQISKKQALFLGGFLYIALIVLASFLSFYFLLIALFIFVLTFLYSLFLKNELFIDILTLAINFVLRTVSGAFVATAGNKPIVWISPWLILCPFFLSLFLSIGKRESELILLGENAKDHKTVLGQYTTKLTGSLMTITTTLLIMSYSLYSFLSRSPLLWTLPIALYIIFRYLQLVYSGSKISRCPEQTYKDIKLCLAVLLLVLIILFILY